MASLLQQLQEADHLLGIISDTGGETGDRVNTVLKKADIFSFFEPSLCPDSVDTGLDKSTPAIFFRATERARLAGRAMPVYSSERISTNGNRLKLPACGFALSCNPFPRLLGR